MLGLGLSGGSVVKNLPANAGDTGDVGSIPGLGRYPGERNGNSLQFLAETSYGQRRLVGLLGLVNPQGGYELATIKRLSVHACGLSTGNFKISQVVLMSS